MHAKDEISISYGSKVMAKVKVFLQQSHRHTGQKLDAPQFHSGGIKITCTYIEVCLPNIKPLQVKCYGLCGGGGGGNSLKTITQVNIRSDCYMYVIHVHSGLIVIISSYLYIGRNYLEV